MKTQTIAIIILGLLFSIKSFSQGKYKTPEQRSEELTKIMTCELGLLDQEITKVKEVNLHAALRMDSIYKEADGKASIIKRKGTAVDKERDILLRRALPAEKYSFYLKIKEEDIDALKKTAGCRPNDKKK